MRAKKGGFTRIIVHCIAITTFLLGDATGFCSFPPPAHVWGSTDAGGRHRAPSLGRLVQRTPSVDRAMFCLGLRASLASGCQGGFEELVSRAEEASSTADPTADAPPCSKTLFKALRKPTKALAIVVGFQRNEMLVHSKVDGLSRACRDAKCAAISVMTEGIEEGLDDLAGFAKEQKKAEGKFPGPCLVLSPASAPRGVAAAWNSPDSPSGAGVAAAAAAGASGVLVPAGADMGGLLAACRSLGVDAICEVRSEEEVQQALKAKCGAISIHAESAVDAERLVALVKSGGDAVIVVSVPAMQRECMEVDHCLRLKAAGADAVLLEAASDDAAGDHGYVKWAVQEIGGKQSKTFVVTVSAGAEQETKEAKWSRQYRERDPAEWSKWEKYRRGRDYQIRATIWNH